MCFFVFFRDSYILGHAIPCFLRHALLDLKETFVLDDPECTSLIGAIRSAKSVSVEVRDLCRSIRGRLEQKMSRTPPFPTNNDQFVLGTLRMVEKDYEGSLNAFGLAGKHITAGIGFAAKVECTFALEKYDDVIALVIECDNRNAIGTAVQAEDKKKHFFQGLKRNNSELQRALAEEDLSLVTSLPVLRRALSYHKLFKGSMVDVYRFKCSEDFSRLFSEMDGKSDFIKATYKACKAMITEDSETACALLHQAAALDPLQWEFPYLSAARRARNDPRALVDIDAAVRLNSDRFLMTYRCILLMEQKREEDALQVLHGLVVNDSDDIWLLCLRGMARELTADTEGACADYKRVVANLQGLPKENVNVSKATCRILCQLAYLESKGCQDSEKERLGLLQDVRKRVEQFSSDCIVLDKERRNYLALKIRATVRMDLGKEKEAALDMLDYCKAMAGNVMREGEDALSRELEICCSMFRKLEDFPTIGVVADIGLVSLSEEKYGGRWKYWKAISCYKGGDKQKALEIALEGYEFVRSEKEDNKEKVRLEKIISKCGGTVSDLVPLHKPAQQKPANVPALQLDSMQMSTRKRRQTIGSTSGRLMKNKIQTAKSSEGTPQAVRKSKSKSGSGKIELKIKKKENVKASSTSDLAVDPPPVMEKNRSKEVIAKRGSRLGASFDLHEKVVKENLNNTKEKSAALKKDIEAAFSEIHQDLGEEEEEKEEGEKITSPKKKEENEAVERKKSESIDIPYSERELDMLKTIEDLKAQLKEANAEIARLKEKK